VISIGSGLRAFAAVAGLERFYASIDFSHLYIDYCIIDYKCKIKIDRIPQIFNFQSSIFNDGTDIQK
jgi:hypothetical protein